MAAVSPRELLAVSWCMPPALFPRSVQVARLLRGLKRLGWTSRVITPPIDQLGAGVTIDTSLDALYREGEDYRIVPVGLDRVDPRFGPMWARWRQRWHGEHRLSDEDLWVKRAVQAAHVDLRQARPQALVTFAQPWRDHLVGLELRRRGAHVPWLAHFSDPWTDSPYAEATGDDHRRELEREREVVEEADAIVFTNRHAEALVMAKYPAALRAKGVVVPHAIDDEVPVMAAPAATGAGPLRVAHVGNLFIGRRSGLALFDALQSLLARRSLDGRLEVQFLGAGSGTSEARAAVFVRRLEGVVTFLPPVPYLDSLAFMRRSDVLLILDADADVNPFLPSKVADYLWAGRPLVALTPRVGATADVMHRLGYPAVAPTDAAAIAGVFEALLDQHERGVLTAAPLEPLAEFRLARVAIAFAAVLDRITRGRA
jgi:hypothetical protein